MSETTKIAWADSTVNFWEGCTKVSEGCRFCYAEARDKRQMIEKVSHWGPNAPRRKSKSAVKAALRMNAKPWICDHCGEARKNRGHSDSAPFCGCLAANNESHRRRIFSLSLGDWLDPEVPIEWKIEMLDTIRQCQRVIWILCTKRPERFFELIGNICPHCDPPLYGWLYSWAINLREPTPPPNVWLLASVENQHFAEKRIPELLKIPAVVHGLSLEPLLEPVDVSRYLAKPLGEFVATPKTEGDLHAYPQPAIARTAGIRWLVIGGESGPQARPCHLKWIRYLHGQAVIAGVPCFVKQLGSCPLEGNGAKCCRVRYTHPKGGDPAEWPEELRVRQWPD